MLAMKRAYAPKGWALPGGLVDPGETPSEAAVREVREETGVAVGDPVPLMSWEDARGRVHAFHCQRQGDARLQGTHEGTPGWVEWSRVLYGPFGQAAENILDRMVTLGIKF